MKINKAYRYELKPNTEQAVLLAKHAGVSRFSYNWGLKQRIELYEKDGNSTNAIEQHRFLNKLKECQFPWMYEVSKCAPQEALRDLDRAFKHFFQGLKTNKKIGFPKFKKKGVRDSFRLTGTIKVTQKCVQLPRLGVIGLKEETNIRGKILSATVCKQADRWFVSLTVEMEIAPPLPVGGPPIGLDLGLTHFVVTSEGEKIVPVKPLHDKIKRLKKLSSQHSRKQKGSNNCKKSAMRLARCHRKISNQRQDFLHKLSTKLAKIKSIIVVEDLNVQEMLQKRNLSRQISDASWSSFIRMLEYKTLWYGSKMIKAPRYFPSSKICSICKTKQEAMPLHIRKWMCTTCHAEHDRDINAAINLMNYYTGSSPGINACGDSSNGVGQKPTSYGSLKQELTNGIFVHKS